MDVAAVAQSIALAYVPPLAGRPSHLADSARILTFLSELQAGVHPEPAASLAGISTASVGLWMKRGAEDDAANDATAYAHFYRAVKSCRAEVEAKVTRNIIKASEKDAFWAAGMTYLERTSPERWARPSDRADRTQSAIEVHVHGIGNNDVSIGIAPRTAALPYIEAQNVGNTVGDHLLHQQAATELQGNEERNERSGAAIPRGAPSPGGGCSTVAVQNLQNPQNEEKNFVLLEQPSSNPGAADSGTEGKKTRRFSNPAAERRAKALKLEGQRLRKKRKLARKTADALRHQANREKALAAKQAQSDEAALPDDVTG